MDEGEVIVSNTELELSHRFNKGRRLYVSDRATELHPISIISKQDITLCTPLRYKHPALGRSRRLVFWRRVLSSLEWHLSHEGRSGVRMNRVIDLIMSHADQGETADRPHRLTNLYGSSQVVSSTLLVVL